MNNKNKYFLVFMFFVCILSISAISATENTIKEVTNTNNKEYSTLETTTPQYNGDVSNSNDDVELKEKENVNDNRQGKSGTDKTTAENNNPLSFSDLNKTINNNTNPTIYLSHNYTYSDSELDYDFKNGIPISRDLTVYGNGVTLDGNNLARIFRVTDSSLNVNFYNINFINGHTTGNGGGAISGVGSAYNCTFTGNTAGTGGARNSGKAYNCTFINNTADDYSGGAIAYGSAYNCTFTGNHAKVFGGAMYQGKASLCRFNTDSDKTDGTTVVPAIINVINYTSTYRSGEKLIFNLTANDMLFDGFNTTITIYKDDEVVVKTVYALSGKGWIVDLEPGEYTAVLSLTDYPEENSTNATISVNKIKPYVVITPITNVKVGQEITITYETNSTGNVTIKVNGQKVTGGKFIPTTNGTYNVTVEVAENEYYTQATNQTTFNAKKVVSKIIVRPITAIYDLDKYLVITLKDEENNPITREVLTVKILGSTKNYKTDSKGQVKIKVPTSAPKTYTARIKYAGSDNYKGSTKSVKVTVKKATPKITAKSASYKLNVKAKKYTTVSLMNQNKIVKNKKVTIKINGKTYTTKTNSKGQATFTMRNLKKTGTYNAVITVTGNYYYNEVTKNVKITVKP